MLKRKSKISKKEYRCSKCGKLHYELPALGFKSPYYYDVLSDADKKQLAVLSDDFCIISYPDQTDRFIRTVLTIPIINSCEKLDYGIWVSVGEKSFNDYKENFQNEASEPIYFGMICNEIKDYDESTLGIHVNVQVRSGGIRPEIIPHQSEHKLKSDWENGILLEEAESRINNILNNVG